MHPLYLKLRRVVVGTGLACAALAAAWLLGEPATRHQEQAGQGAHAAVSTAAQVQADNPEHVLLPAAAARSVSQRGAAFLMPYFSFGAVLPRASSPSEP